DPADRISMVAVAAPAPGVDCQTVTNQDHDPDNRWRRASETLNAEREWPIVLQKAPSSARLPSSWLKERLELVLVRPVGVAQHGHACSEVTIPDVRKYLRSREQWRPPPQREVCVVRETF